MDILIIAALVLGSLCVGLVVGLGVKRIADIRKKNVAMSEAELILDHAREEQRKIVLEAKEEALQNRREGESELRERRSELRNLERRVESREENVEGRAKNLDKRERRNVEREKEIEIIAAEVETLQNSKVQELEKIADLTVDERRKSWLTLMPEKEFNEKKIPTMPQPAHSFSFSRYPGLLHQSLELIQFLQIRW